MDGVSKIYSRGSFWQVDDFSFRGKAKNSVFKKIDTERIQKFPGLGGIFLKFNQLIYPSHLRFDASTVSWFAGLFICPVGSDTTLGFFVHFFGANLDFGNFSFI